MRPNGNRNDTMLRMLRVAPIQIARGRRPRHRHGRRNQDPNSPRRCRLRHGLSRAMEPPTRRRNLPTLSRKLVKTAASSTTRTPPPNHPAPPAMKFITHNSEFIITFVRPLHLPRPRHLRDSQGRAPLSERVRRVSRRVPTSQPAPCSSRFALLNRWGPATRYARSE
jgi:hypothetical protein